MVGIPWHQPEYRTIEMGVACRLEVVYGLEAVYARKGVVYAMIGEGSALFGVSAPGVPPQLPHHPPLSPVFQPSPPTNMTFHPPSSYPHKHSAVAVFPHYFPTSTTRPC